MSRTQKELGPQLFLLAAGKRPKVTENCTGCGLGQLQKQLSQARLTSFDPNSFCMRVVLSGVMASANIVVMGMYSACSYSPLRVTVVLYALSTRDRNRWLP